MTLVPMSYDELKAVLPHRYPFLLVDKIIELTTEKAVGIKAITGAESFVTGHFPSRAIYPGVLILESMAQVAAILGGHLVFNSVQIKKNLGQENVLSGLDNARFRAPVVPGDLLRVEANFSSRRRQFVTCDCAAYVENKLVASASVRMYHENPNNIKPSSDE